MSACLSENDLDFFQEVPQLMDAKYPNLKEKFGIWRVHQHFEKNEDEVFHETSNLITKESTLRIVKKTDLPEQAFASTWKLGESGPYVCTWCCDDHPLK